MAVERQAHSPTADTPNPDLPLWHALRPEARSAGLRWNDLRTLAARQQLRSDDYVWHPTWPNWRPAKDVPGLIENHVLSPHLSLESTSTPQKNIKERARHELRSYLIITAYVWAIISLLRLHQDVLAETYHITFESQGRAIVLALILGKVVLIAEALRLGDFFSNRFPALAVAIRSIFFAAAILMFHACEEIVVGLWNGKDVPTVVAELSPDVMMRSLLLALMMAIALVPYFLIKEIEKRTGQSDLLLLAVGLKR